MTDLPDFLLFDEDDEPDPLNEPIATRVERGRKNDSVAEGGIVPFHPAYHQYGLPPDVRERLNRIRGVRTAQFYHSAAGDLLQIQYRIEYEGKKKFLPLTYCGNGNYAFMAIPGLRPLYGLQRLVERPDAPVLWVEGEKAADRAQQRFPDYAVITSMSGAESVHRTEMFELKGRDLTIWRDNDEAGMRAARMCAAQAWKAGAKSGALVEIPRIPRKARSC